MKKKVQSLPLVIFYNDRRIAYLDLDGNWHCAERNKKRVVKVLSDIYIK